MSIQYRDKIRLEGNNGGNFIELKDNEDGTARLQVGHCCVIGVAATVPNEFLSAVLSRVAMEHDYDLESVMRWAGEGWPKDYVEKLESSIVPLGPLESV